jgi:hypothetical protein
MRRAEDEVPVPDDKETLRKRKQNERERRRPPRHQVTVDSLAEAVVIAGGEFLAGYPNERIPFTRTAKAKDRKRSDVQSPWKVIVRRRCPLKPPSQPQASGTADDHPDTESVEAQCRAPD